MQSLQLQTIGGDEYMVHGCWGKDPVAHPRFKRLAAEQHPKALSELEGWGVLLHNTGMAAHALGLPAVGGMLVRGEVGLGEPVLVIWTELEDTEGADRRSSDESATAIGSNLPRDDAFVATVQPDGDGDSPKRQLPESALQRVGSTAAGWQHCSGLAALQRVGSTVAGWQHCSGLAAP